MFQISCEWNEKKKEWINVLLKHYHHKQYIFVAVNNYKYIFFKVLDTYSYENKIKFYENLFKIMTKSFVDHDNSKHYLCGKISFIRYKLCSE